MSDERASPDSQEDWALLFESARGNDDAFARLVERHQQKLLNFFLRSGAKHHAEDLVQETFLRLYRHRKRAKPLARFTTYLHTLGHHVWLDHVRRQSRFARLLMRAAPEFNEIDCASANRPPVSMDADSLLGLLSPDHREAVVLVVYQGMAYHEAAEILGVPVGTVKSRVSIALSRIRAALRATHRGEKLHGS
ncbi:MAG: RNA polymerase sigma factor [Kiritimatiellae bacterium]|nr:RNA polymerase sigma factor [Kiritimatiellia bacterium]MDW8459153.1 RNA polymerase sigma factor [Verrucomicrobiota bacterium]